MQMLDEMGHFRATNMKPEKWAFRRYFSGFSLIEMMIVVAIFALLLSIAVPAFTQMLANFRIRAATSELVSDLAYARVEAVKRGARVGVGSANWKNGWFVFVDAGAAGFTNGTDSVGAGVLKSHEALRSTMAVCGKDAAGAAVSLDSVVFGGDGSARLYFNGGAAANDTRLLVANAGSNAGGRSRQLSFSPTGRVNVQTSGIASETCP